MQEIILQLVPRIRDDVGKLQCALQIPVQDVLELHGFIPKTETFALHSECTPARGPRMKAMISLIGVWKRGKPRQPRLGASTTRLGLLGKVFLDPGVPDPLWIDATKNVSSRLGRMADQDSLRLTVQSWLEYIDKLDHRVHDEIQETRSRLLELLDNCQSDVTMGDSGGYDSTVDSQAELDERRSRLFEIVFSCYSQRPIALLSESRDQRVQTLPSVNLLKRSTPPPVPPTMGPLLNLHTARALRPFQ
ncbi:hypothetical protein EV702DRAFT_1267821 [Suillus placidus]|uniref:Uncharacterized protein n=1 Tax=Suillus placidus TaxID=48579 RepID=A0A9P6ZWY0_9AGAM|nr:hypothetical protein EV702DRAFT_1267821 [Suillus placidus]